MIRSCFVLLPFPFLVTLSVFYIFININNTQRCTDNLPSASSGVKTFRSTKTHKISTKQSNTTNTEIHFPRVSVSDEHKPVHVCCSCGLSCGNDDDNRAWIQVTGSLLPWQRRAKQSSSRTCRRTRSTNSRSPLSVAATDFAVDKSSSEHWVSCWMECLFCWWAQIPTTWSCVALALIGTMDKVIASSAPSTEFESESSRGEGHCVSIFNASRVLKE